MSRNNHDSRPSCTTPFPSTNLLTRCSSGNSISLVCFYAGAQFSSSASSAPPWPKGSSSSPQPALCSTSWALAYIVGGCQLCTTLHSDRFHVCPTFFSSCAMQMLGFQTVRFSSVASFSCGLVYAAARTRASAGNATRFASEDFPLSWPLCQPSRPQTCCHSISKSVDFQFLRCEVAPPHAPRMLYCGSLSRASETRHHSFPLIPRFALASRAMEARRYSASTMTSNNLAAFVFSASTTSATSLCSRHGQLSQDKAETGHSRAHSSQSGILRADAARSGYRQPHKVPWETGVVSLFSNVVRFFGTRPRISKQANVI